MASRPFTLPSGRSVEEIAREAKLAPPAMALLDPGAPPTRTVEALLEAGEFAEAAKFLALCLPPRAAVWWAWGCATQVHGDDAPEKVRVLLEATRAWIAEPTDPRRRECFRLAEESGLDSAAALAALAVYLSSGSLAAPEVDPPVAPPEFGCGKVVGGAVLLGALADPEKTEERWRLFLKQGLEVARKARAWNEAGPGGAP